MKQTQERSAVPLGTDHCPVASGIGDPMKQNLQYTPDNKRTKHTKSNKNVCNYSILCLFCIIYIELLFGNVGLNGSLNSEIIAVHVEDPFSGTVYYTIRGGICIVQIWFISCKSGKLTCAPIAKNLPYAAMCAGTLGENYAGGTGSGIFMYINVNTNAICCHKAEDCHEFFGSFCYPVIK